MAAVLEAITGTVSVSLDGHDPQGVGTFTIPVTTNLDSETGIVTLDATPHDAIITAMAAALRDAADELLATIPTAETRTA